MVLAASAPTTLSAINFLRLPIAFPLEAFQQQFSKLSQQPWLAHVNRRDYRGGWDVLPLRCQTQHQNAHPILQGFAIEAGNKWSDLPLLAELPALQCLLSQLLCPLKAVRLMRLRAGAEIKPHRDHGLGAGFGQARLHLPVQTHEAVEFTVNNQRVPMRAGELWYINADREHAVKNGGAQPRINVVIDCEVNNWLQQLLLSKH